MTGLLILLACVLVFALSVPAAILAASVHGHAIRGVGILLVPVAPIVVLVLAVVADLGWWLVAIAAIPLLLMVVGLQLRDSDSGRNMWSDMPKRRRSTRADAKTRVQDSDPPTPSSEPPAPPSGLARRPDGVVPGSIGDLSIRAGMDVRELLRDGKDIGEVYRIIEEREKRLGGEPTPED